MHLRDETANALGLFRYALRNCAGETEVQKSSTVPFSSAPELSLDGSRGRKLTKDVEIPLLRLDRASGCVQMLFARGDAHRYGR